MIEPHPKFAVIGLGVLGGSYVQALSQKGYDCIGIDVDEAALAYAKEKHWIQEGSTDPSIVKDADIVVSALYPHTCVEWVKANQHFMKPGALLTDVTGIKREIIRDIHAELRDDVEFIACHPMAGKEFKGIQYADAQRFANANRPKGSSCLTKRRAPSVRWTRFAMPNNTGTWSWTRASSISTFAQR